MKDDSRQLTLAAAAADVSKLEHYDWTFARANTQYLTHGLHKYPARMPPQIPSTLLNFYESQGDIETESVVYDPFSGSGTTSVEARLNGHHAIANDINPFACMLTAGKAIPLNIERLEEAASTLFDGLQGAFNQLASDQHRPRELLSEKSLVDAKEIGTDWFPQPQLYQLLYARQRIDELEDKGYDRNIVQFLRICLAKTSRRVSYQRVGEFKRYRMEEKDRLNHQPNVHKELRDSTNENISRMKDYSRQVDHSLDTTVFKGDSRHVIDTSDYPISTNEADIVITSPPYGDHRTTVAYGEFSTNVSVIAEGRDFDEMLSVDDQGLGGSDSSSISIKELEEWSTSLHTVVKKLREIEGRSKDAVGFFEDYAQVISEVAKVTKPSQPVVWVVACRRMSDELIPINEITRELCEYLGYTFETEIPRYIRGKTLPNKNRQGKTMAKEYIVVMRAPE